MYAIQPQCGFKQIAAILGINFSGFMVRFRWGVYRRFAGAVQQNRLAHLLRRCRRMIAASRCAVACLPLAPPQRSPESRRFANHPGRERVVLFAVLYCPGLEATNWRAKPAIRPVATTRKEWADNQTSAGARAQGILLSILQSYR